VPISPATISLLKDRVAEELTAIDTDNKLRLAMRSDDPVQLTGSVWAEG
jgi:hypothetical protein